MNLLQITIIVSVVIALIIIPKVTISWIANKIRKKKKEKINKESSSILKKLEEEYTLTKLRGKMRRSSLHEKLSMHQEIIELVKNGSPNLDVQCKLLSKLSSHLNTFFLNEFNELLVDRVHKIEITKNNFIMYYYVEENVVVGTKRCKSCNGDGTDGYGRPGWGQGMNCGSCGGSGEEDIYGKKDEEYSKILKLNTP